MAAINDDGDGGESSNQLTFLLNGRNFNEIPATATHLIFLSFVDCEGYSLRELERLVSVTLLSGIKRIESCAFEDCESLRDISIPMTVEIIEEYAFYNCHSLVEIELHEGLREIQENAFESCKSLSRVSIPSTVNLISVESFAYCESLVEVELREGLQHIADEAFTHCVSLCGVSIPSTTETIGDSSFSGCVRLLGVEFSNNTSLTTMSTSCFNDCPALVNIFNPDVPEIFFAEGSPLSRIGSRYWFLPIHECCYFASSSSASYLASIFEAFSIEEKKQKDAFGMTPFHVIATSAKLRLDLFLVLLDKYPLDTLSQRDNNDKTMLDYLLMNSTPKAIPLIKLLLQKIIIDQMSQFGMEHWILDLWSLIESTLDWNGKLGVRRQCLDRVLERLSCHVKTEAALFLELALWKKSARALAVESFFLPGFYKRRKVDRDRTSRVMSGASVVIPSVLGFLSEDLSMLPSQFSWMKVEEKEENEGTRVLALV